MLLAVLSLLAHMHHQRHQIVCWCLDCLSGMLHDMAALLMVCHRDSAVIQTDIVTCTWQFYLDKTAMCKSHGIIGVLTSPQPNACVRRTSRRA